MYLEAALKELHGLLATDGGVASDLLVTANAEGTNGESGLGEHGLLAGQALEHLGGTGQTIARLSDTNVENELLEEEVLHGVHRLCLRFLSNDRTLVICYSKGTSSKTYSSHVCRRKKHAK